MRTWAKLHPGWDHVIWTDANLPEMRNIAEYHAMDTWNGKSDILRYEVLLRHGGVYCDADSLCVRPIDELIERHRSFAVYENETDHPGLIASGYVGIEAGSTLMRALVDGLTGRPVSERESGLPAWRAVGPGYFTETILALDDPIVRLPSWTFLPRHHNGRQQAQGGRPYCRHYWGTTHGSGGRRKRWSQNARIGLDLLLWEIEQLTSRARSD